MLVLDCSSSIDKDFVIVQEGAKAFIQSLYEASNGTGNIKLGIVSFSKINETKFFNIRPLTSSSYYDMNRFINSLSTQNGTALYYAMDKSVELMEEYCNNSIPSDEPLSAAVMVTFTDGLDQTSRDSDKNILTADSYYDEVLSKYGTKMQRVSINGIPLQPEIRGVKGNDIITDAQLGKFQRIGESLGSFKLLKDYSELGAAFGDIAQNLIDQWRILNLYVPNSFSGKVAWTYPSRKQIVVEKPIIPKEPKKKGSWFVGLNAGFGLSNYYSYGYKHYQNVYGGSVYEDNDSSDDIGLAFSGGIDLAFPIGRAVNLGLFGSIGLGLGIETASTTCLFNAGPLLLINFKNNSSLYLGGGVSMEDFEEIGLDLRAGFKFKKGLYLFGELFSISYNWSREQSFYIIDGYNHNYYNGYEDYGHYSYYTDTYNSRLTGFLFHIGYSF